MPNTFCKKNRPIKHKTHAATGVMTHPNIILARTNQRIAAAPCKIEMPTIAPTTAWELDTGTNGIVGSPSPASQASNPTDANMNKTIE